jgi:hypothetical protein
MNNDLVHETSNLWTLSNGTLKYLQYTWETESEKILDSITGVRCYPDLPAPKLIVSGTEDYEANNMEWTRYRLEVVNWAEFPDELFEPAPDLPTCGLNKNASRTWVKIYDESDYYIYGFQSSFTSL